MHKFLFSRLLCVAVAAVAIAPNAQAIEQDAQKPTAAKANSRHATAVDSGRRLSLWYENDLFTQTDRYYSQGIGVTLHHPTLSRADVLGILTPRARGPRYYFAQLALEGYTPSTIRSDSILYGDRPYAGVVYLRIGGSSYPIDGRGTSTSGSILLGVIGPVTGGREIQTAIHSATDNFLPLGWQHQIQNDLLLNYSASVEKTLLSQRRYALRMFAQAEVGTYLNRFAVGTNATLFQWQSRSKTKAGISMLMHVRGTLVGYDARLQGGLFNRSSPYVLRADEIRRLTAQASLILALRLGRISLIGNADWLTTEFSGGELHRWGGLANGYTF